MPAIPREERILNLLSALLAANAPVPFQDIRGRVAGYDDQASPDAIDKRFDRDKADLRKLGVPLDFVTDDEHGRSGYRVQKELFFLDEIRFTVEEGIVLAALQRACEAGEAVEESLRSALLKIGVDSPLSVALRGSVAEQQLLDPRLPTGRSVEQEALAVLAEALALRRQVRFSYYTLGRGEVRERTLQPYGVGYFHGSWYLVGRDVELAEERVFRTSRIQGVVSILTDPAEEIPPDFNLRDRVGVPPWQYRGGPVTTARVRFVPHIAWMIEDNLQPGQSFASAPDGSGVLTLDVTEPVALIRWVAQYGSAAEILEPADFREFMVEHLEGVRARCPE
jgi:predicted DNA-binding transcriptional regulator YafY